MTSGQVLDDVEAILMRLTVLLPEDKGAWDANELLRLAVERLWVLAGNTAEEYRQAAGLDADVAPFTELYDFRCVLAHWSRGQASPDRVWHEGVRDLPRLLEQVRAARR